MARKLRWTDVNDIAIELEEAHPDADNVNLRFTDLHKWVMALPGFDDDRQQIQREDPRGHPGRLDRRKRVNAPITPKSESYGLCHKGVFMRGISARAILLPVLLAAGVGACANNGVQPGYVNSASGSARLRHRPTARARRFGSRGGDQRRQPAGRWRQQRQRPEQRHHDGRPAGRPGRHRHRRLGRPRPRRRPDRRRAGRGRRRDRRHHHRPAHQHRRRRPRHRGHGPEGRRPAGHRRPARRRRRAARRPRADPPGPQRRRQGGARQRPPAGLPEPERRLPECRPGAAGLPPGQQLWRW